MLTGISAAASTIAAYAMCNRGAADSGDVLLDLCLASGSINIPDADALVYARKVASRCMNPAASEYVRIELELDRCIVGEFK